MPSRRGVFLTVLIAVLVLLHGIPWWRLVIAPSWPKPVTIGGTIATVLLLVAF